MKALIVVDVQNDFLPGGALAVPEGDQVIPEIVRLIESGEYATVITTGDNHPQGTRHFEKWPAHCVMDTAGAALDSALKGVVEQHPDRHHVVKGESMEDDGYSAFEGMDDRDGRSLNEILGTFGPTQRADSIQHVDVVGLATDYCVKATALDAVKLGYETTVILGATRPVDPETGRLAEIEMFEAGVGMVRACWNCKGSGIRCCEYAARV